MRIAIGVEKCFVSGSGCRPGAGKIIPAASWLFLPRSGSLKSGLRGRSFKLWRRHFGGGGGCKQRRSLPPLLIQAPAGCRWTWCRRSLLAGRCCWSVGWPSSSATGRRGTPKRERCGWKPVRKEIWRIEGITFRTFSKTDEEPVSFFRRPFYLGGVAFGFGREGLLFGSDKRYNFCGKPKLERSVFHASTGAAL